MCSAGKNRLYDDRRSNFEPIDRLRSRDVLPGGVAPPSPPDMCTSYMLPRYARAFPDRWTTYDRRIEGGEVIGSGREVKELWKKKKGWK